MAEMILQAILKAIEILRRITNYLFQKLKKRSYQVKSPILAYFRWSDNGYMCMKCDQVFEDLLDDIKHKIQDLTYAIFKIVIFYQSRP